MKQRRATGRHDWWNPVPAPFTSCPPSPPRGLPSWSPSFPDLWAGRSAEASAPLTSGSAIPPPHGWQLSLPTARSWGRYVGKAGWEKRGDTSFWGQILTLHTSPKGVSGPQLFLSLSQQAPFGSRQGFRLLEETAPSTPGRGLAPLWPLWLEPPAVVLASLWCRHSLASSVPCSPWRSHVFPPPSLGEKSVEREPQLLSPQAATTEVRTP